MHYLDIDWQALQDELPDLLGEVTAPIVGKQHREVRDTDPHFYDTERVEKCGWCISHTYGGNGEYNYSPSRCEYFRACKKCLEFRAAYYTTFAARAINSDKEHGITILVFEPGYDDAVDHIRSIVTAQDYLRMPMDDGSIAVMLMANEPILSKYDYPSMCSKIINCKDIDEARALDWDIWVKTPYRKSLTGGLGRPNKAEVSEDVVTGVIDEIAYCNAPAKIVLDAVEYAIRATPNKPETDDEVIPAINKRVAITAEYLTSAGYSYKKVSRQRGVKVIRLNGRDNIRRIVWRTILENEQVESHKLVFQYTDWLVAMARIPKT